MSEAAGWVGRTVGGRYEILSLIGHGGMGTVFRARDSELEETVALKVLRRDLLEMPGVVERFRREVKLARRVTHRNVARVFDIGEHAGDRFLTMELVEGEMLSERLRRGPLTLAEATRIALAIAEGMSAAHAAGVVHRDLKPENVMLAKDGRVVITDFGIARARFDEGDALRTIGTAVGTPAYMAPEQIEPGHEIDARADIYAFGAVMFELYTGKRAWPGDAAIAVAAARLLQPPPDPLVARPDLPGAYAAIVSRCLARKPADRFPSAEAVALALRIPFPFSTPKKSSVEAHERAEAEAEAEWRSAHGSEPAPAGPVVGYDARTAPTIMSVALQPATLRGETLSPPVTTRETLASTVPPSAMMASVVASAPGTLASPTPALPVTKAPPSAPQQAALDALGPLFHPVEAHSYGGASEGGAAPTPTTGTLAPTTGRTGSDPTVTTAPGSQPKTVAVLPFRNAGGAEDEYLADGITDELIDTLSMTPGLRVRSRGVVMPHKGTDADPRELGARLDVGLVVEGSVRRTPAGVRITARVVAVRDGSQVWAKRFDKGTVDVFEVSDEVARAVAEALTLESAAPHREAPTDPEAMDLYLRARQEYRKYWPESVRQAVVLFEQALERAPGNPTILSAYALACARLWWFGGAPGAEAGAKARMAAEQAQAAAPHLGEPHLAMSQVLWNSGDAAGAAREIVRAITCSPTLAEAHALKGRILIEAAQLEAGIRSLTTATTLEPNVPLALGELARAYAFLGRWDEIPVLAERNAALEGPQALWFMRARFTLWRRDQAGAAQFLAEMKDQSRILGVAKWLFEQLLAPSAPSETIDLSFFVAGDDASARRRSFIYQLETEVRAFHGQLEGALTSVERSVAEGLFDAAWMDRCPLLAPLQGHARFRASRAIVGDRVREALLALP